MSGVLGAVKFNPIGYSQYIDAAKKLYISNIDAVYAYCELKSPSYDEGVQIFCHLDYFRHLCEDLLNQDCRFGPYKPDSFDAQRLLGWLDGNAALHNKLYIKVSSL
ncbi:hypothetical protein JHQ11_003276, partial [Salmonella enterica subsp. enterica serovar Javiana]|nr:hypothetical protein [Salmonella enterica subsp. enterica serovar Javiana]ELD4650040.1 hypothetical protein [Salmonella enterica subsp. enterica serovar Javiana]